MWGNKRERLNEGFAYAITGWSGGGKGRGSVIAAKGLSYSGFRVLDDGLLLVLEEGGVSG